MRYAFVATIAVLGLGVEVAGNPVASYRVPYISEFQMTDSITWAIELTGSSTSWPATSAAHIPCTTSAFKLRIVSTNKKYNFTASFDADTIAVIRISAVIHQNDTLEILDTTGTIMQDSCIFVVRPVKPGHSLIDTLAVNSARIPSAMRCFYPVETCRPSIGSRGNYTTIHTLHLLDSNKNKLPYVYMYNAYVVWAENLGKFSPPPILIDTVSVSGSAWT